MAEFLQNYGIWIALIAGMFLMHRLGIGCCGGHRHGEGHGDGATRTEEPKRSKRKATFLERSAEGGVASRSRQDSCH